MNEKKRFDMVHKCAKNLGASDDAPLMLAMKLVPREMFLSEQYVHDAYKDKSLPVGNGRKLQSPLLIAKMLELTDPTPEKMCLEIKSGTGYVSAVASFLFQKVVGVEPDQVLATTSRQTLFKLGLDRVTIKEKADEMFDSIILSEPVSEIPTNLFPQIAPFGTLVFLLESPEEKPCIMTIHRDGWKKMYTQKSYPMKKGKS